jgi:hypothetical protein
MNNSKNVGYSEEELPAFDFRQLAAEDVPRNSSFLNRPGKIIRTDISLTGGI